MAHGVDELRERANATMRRRPMSSSPAEHMHAIKKMGGSVTAATDAVLTTAVDRQGRAGTC